MQKLGVPQDVSLCRIWWNRLWSFYPGVQPSKIFTELSRHHSRDHQRRLGRPRLLGYIQWKTTCSRGTSDWILRGAKLPAELTGVTLSARLYAPWSVPMNDCYPYIDGGEIWRGVDLRGEKPQNRTPNNFNDLHDYKYCYAMVTNFDVWQTVIGLYSQNAENFVKVAKGIRTCGALI